MSSPPRNEDRKKVNLTKLGEMRALGEPIVMVTAYDHPSAQAVEAADILEFEQVAVVDVDNGARFETYTIAGERGSGEVKVNGAAARLVHHGDTVIVISYAQYSREELDCYEPRVVHVDRRNRIVTVDREVATLLA